MGGWCLCPSQCRSCELPLLLAIRHLVGRKHGEGPGPAGGSPRPNVRPVRPVAVRPWTSRAPALSDLQFALCTTKAAECRAVRSPCSGKVPGASCLFCPLPLPPPAPGAGHFPLPRPPPPCLGLRAFPGADSSAGPRRRPGRWPHCDAVWRGAFDASFPAGFGQVPGPVLRLSFKCCGRLSICMTSLAEDTVPSGASDSHHLVVTVGGG